MVLIYTPIITKRFQYVCGTIFKEILNIPFEFTDKINYFQESSKIKINYSSNFIENSFQIMPVGLLEETKIQVQPIEIIYIDDIPVFYYSNSDFDLKFDIFSASFYLITRYEEYLPFKPDKHERFPAEESLAFKNNFLNRPLINEWCYYLKQKLEEKFKLSIKSENAEFKYISTIDLDNIFAFKGKPLVRIIGGFGKDIINFRIFNAINRFASIVGIRKDPFDHYKYHQKIQIENKHKLIYFIPFANNSKFDVNVTPNSKLFKKLIKFLSTFAEIGIHPSYQSNIIAELLGKEQEYYRKITGNEIISSRQHFLMLTFPQTYKKLVAHNIFNDYSMGYSTQNGFRASVCNSFNFYDLQLEEETALRIHPFTIMDSVFVDQQNKSSDVCKNEILYYIKTIKKYNGLFISVWHDRSFNDKSKYQGWKDLYKVTVENSINNSIRD